MTASPYLTAIEAAQYLRYPTVDALRAGIRRHHIPHIKRGRQLFFDQRQLDGFMRVVSDISAPKGRRPHRKTVAA